MYFVGLFKKYKFVFSELVKRDFKLKYKRSVLGIIWSMLAPLFTLMVMNFIFVNVFGRTQEYYTIYLFSGYLIFQYYSEATNGAMNSLVANSSIFSKVAVPKYLFLFSKVTSSSINFFIVLIVYFIFVIAYGLPITLKMLMLFFPVCSMFILILGIGLILSALYVFFKDIQYLYSVFLTALMYFSAIFYTPDILGEKAFLLYINPVFHYINYFRKVVILGEIPSVLYHVGMIGYSFLFFLIGCFMYKKFNHKFLYYV